MRRIRFEGGGEIYVDYFVSKMKALQNTTLYLPYLRRLLLLLLLLFRHRSICSLNVYFPMEINLFYISIFVRHFEKQTFDFISSLFVRLSVRLRLSFSLVFIPGADNC